MKITLKNVKIAKFASQETLCFEATVYVDGVRAFVASNDGNGGADDYDVINKALFDAAEAYITQKYPEATIWRKP